MPWTAKQEGSSPHDMMSSGTNSALSAHKPTPQQQFVMNPTSNQVGIAAIRARKQQTTHLCM
eukprot:14461929-Ditylum_brightwellii.AAC.1